MASGARIRVLEGFYRWLEGGGREMLSRLAKNREKRKRWERRMLKQQALVGRNFEGLSNVKLLK
jgi:hypothetical protein